MRLLLQPFSNGKSVFLVLLHTQRQSFDAADNELGIKCSQTGAGCVGRTDFMNTFCCKFHSVIFSFEPAF